MNPFDIQKRPSAVPGNTPALSEMDKMLLSLLASQTGADLNQLTRDYQSGNIDALLSALPEDKRAAARQVIRDPAAMEKARQMASSDAVQKIINGLKGK